MRNITAITSIATMIKPAAMCRLTVPTKAIAQTVAKQGGNTFHTNMFSTVNNALAVAVTRDVSVPGEDAAK